MRKRANRWHGFAAVAVAAVCVALVVPLWLAGVAPDGSAPLAPDGEKAGRQLMDERRAAVQADVDSSSDPGVSASAFAERVTVTDDDGASYRAGEVLAYVGEGAASDPAELAGFNERLSAVANLPEQEIKAEDVVFGWTRVLLADGQDVRQQAAQLVEDGVAIDAQPNYVYHMDEPATGASQARDSLKPGVSPGLSDGDDAQEVIPLPDDPTPADSSDTPPRDFPSDRYGAGYDPKVNSQWEIYATKADYAYNYLSQHYSELTYTDANGTVRNLTSPDDPLQRPSIAVLDTGCKITHEDLEGNIVDYYDAVFNIPKEQVDSGEVSPGLALIDIHGHGTSVCGVASAVTRNGKGVAGAGANSGLVPIMVFEYDKNGDLGADSYTIEKGYQFVLSHAAADRIRVINMSLGANYENESVDVGDRVLLNAIDKAASQGILTVVSAGNDGYAKAYRDFPTYFAESGIGVIAVQVVNDHWGLSRSWFSNYNKAGTAVEQLCGPGVLITTTKRNGGYSTTEEWLSGTSYSAPCVAGVAALTFAFDPGLTVDQMKSVLFSSALDIAEKPDGDGTNDQYSPGFDLMSGFGMVDAYAAVQASNCYLDGGTSLGVGGTVTLAPSVGANERAAAAGLDSAWMWTSSDNAIATVQDGVVTGVSAGAVAITATVGTGEDAQVLSQVVTVHAPTVSGADQVYTGKSTTYSISEPLASNAAWTWESSNPEIATVDAASGKVTGKTVGTATITATMNSNRAVTASKDIAVANQPAPAPSPATPKATTKDMYRLYNPWSGEHFYTSSASERNNLTRAGWRYEGVGWKAPVSGSDVYRLYNRYSGDHHFTTSAAEKDACVKAGWTYEGVGWKSGGSAKVYREYNPYAKAFYHNYTASASEHRGLIAAGWRDEGVGWYGS